MKFKVARYLFLSVFMSFGLVGFADEEKAITISGRLIEKDNKVYIQGETGGKAKQFLLHHDFYLFRGQTIWVEGTAQGDYLVVKNLVSEKNSLIFGRVGYGVYLEGSLRDNGKGGLDFIPRDKHARKLLNGKESFEVRIPEESAYAGFNSEAYSAFVRGVISGDTLHVSAEPYSIHIVQHRRLAEEGDVVVLSASMVNNGEEGTFDFATHGRGSRLRRSEIASRVGHWQVLNVSDVFVKNPETGELIPAELKDYARFFASVAENVDDDVNVEVTMFPEIEAPIVRTYVGQLKLDNLLLITDSQDYVSGAIPALTTDPKKRKTSSAEVLTVVKTPHKFSVIQGGRTGVDCENIIGGQKPNLTVVEPSDQ